MYKELLKEVLKREIKNYFGEIIYRIEIVRTDYDTVNFTAYGQNTYYGYVGSIGQIDIIGINKKFDCIDDYILIN